MARVLTLDREEIKAIYAKAFPPDAFHFYRDPIIWVQGEDILRFKLSNADVMWFSYYEARHLDLPE